MKKLKILFIQIKKYQENLIKLPGIGDKTLKKIIEFIEI